MDLLRLPLPPATMQPRLGFRPSSTRLPFQRHRVTNECVVQQSSATLAKALARDWDHRPRWTGPGPGR
jgi:hypothetical protein